MNPAPLLSRHTVMSYELDSFGHVNNAVFLNYLEKARNDFMIQRGLHFNDFFAWRRYPLVARAQLEYKRPARAGEELTIHGRVTAVSPATFTLAYEIVTSDGAIVLRGETYHVFVDDNGRPARIPEIFRERFLQDAPAVG